MISNAISISVINIICPCHNGLTENAGLDNDGTIRTGGHCGPVALMSSSCKFVSQCPVLQFQLSRHRLTMLDTERWARS